MSFLDSALQAPETLWDAMRRGFNLGGPGAPPPRPPANIPVLGQYLVAGKDPSHVTGLSTRMQDRLGAMFNAMPPEIRDQVRIQSGFRTPEHQARLYDAAVQKYGSEAAARRWVAPPGQSVHNKGDALDFKYGSPEARQWVLDNADKFGLKRPLANEPWHIEAYETRGGPRFVGQLPAQQIASNAPTTTTQPTGNVLAFGPPTERFTPMRASATTGDAVGRYLGVISHMESRGNYNALGPVTRNGDRAYGAYQIMGNNIPQWSKEALGRPISAKEFMASPALQDQIARYKFSQYVEKFGPEGAARAWFGGPGAVNRPGARDQLGTTVGSYGSTFEQLAGRAPQQAPVKVANAPAVQAIQAAVQQQQQPAQVMQASVQQPAQAAPAPAAPAVSAGVVDMHRMLDTPVTTLVKQFAPNQAGMVPGFIGNQSLRQVLQSPFGSMVQSHLQPVLGPQLKKWGVTPEQFNKAITEPPPPAQPAQTAAAQPAPAQPAPAQPAPAQPAPAQPAPATGGPLTFVPPEEVHHTGPRPAPTIETARVAVNNPGDAGLPAYPGPGTGRTADQWVPPTVDGNTGGFTYGGRVPITSGGSAVMGNTGGFNSLPAPTRATVFAPPDVAAPGISRPAAPAPTPPAAQTRAAPVVGPATRQNAPASPAGAPGGLSWFQRQGFLQRDPETRAYLDPTLAARAGARDLPPGLVQAVNQIAAPQGAPMPAPRPASAPDGAPMPRPRPASAPDAPPGLRGFNAEALPFDERRLPAAGPPMANIMQGSRYDNGRLGGTMPPPQRGFNVEALPLDERRLPPLPENMFAGSRYDNGVPGGLLQPSLSQYAPTQTMAPQAAPMSMESVPLGGQQPWWLPQDQWGGGFGGWGGGGAWGAPGTDFAMVGFEPFGGGMTFSGF